MDDTSVELLLFWTFTRWVLLGVYIALVPNILIRTIGLWLDDGIFEVAYNMG